MARAIGLATIDENFRNNLLENPESIRGGEFDLDPREIDFLKDERTRTMIRDYAERMNISYDTAGGKSR